jgi:acetyl esterase
VVAQLTAHSNDAPAAQLLIYPAVDATSMRSSHELFATGLFLTMRDVDAFARAYRGGAGGAGGAGDDPRVSPMTAPDLRGLPPALVITAGFDVLRDEGEAYAKALTAAGNTVRLRRFPSLTHGFIHITDLSPAARVAMRDSAREWRALLDGEPARHDHLRAGAAR